jgi:AraC-like DNA-binding protein
VHNYILRRRLSRIKRTLQESGNRERIADLAARFGFTCQETFWRAFKREYGVSPGEVRSLNSKDQTNELHNADVGFDQWLRYLGV